MKDTGGRKLGYFYYKQEPGRRTTAKMLTKDEASRISANAKLPELLTRRVRDQGGLALLSVGKSG